MKTEEIYRNAAEYGAFHDEDCCVNQEGAGACDVGTPILGCCDQMKTVKLIIDDTIRSVVESLSHDIFDNEELRKAGVAMYLEELV